jgi:hypothetical protein
MMSSSPSESTNILLLANTNFKTVKDATNYSKLFKYILKILKLIANGKNIGV